jgi:putative ABC transport system ATP-binding protein
MLVVKDLKKTFQTGDTAVHAVDNISFEVKDGQFASIIGKSGSGKSTLLGLLGALEKPTSGSVTVNQQDVTKMSDHALTAYRAKKIGFRATIWCQI